jgi:hypothetical protein
MTYGLWVRVRVRVRVRVFGLMAYGSWLMPHDLWVRVGDRVRVRRGKPIKRLPILKNRH